MMKYLVIALLAIYIILLYKPFLIEGKMPIPADTIAGLYHPWRDHFLKDYPTNVSFKNFQITDPVRQQFPWRALAIENFKANAVPLWNPYSFSGTPLLGNFQSAVFYPLNILFLILDFNLAWSILVLLQLLLGGLFMYFYLKNLKLHSYACAIGLLAWIGSGFFVAWQQWNTVVHTIIWLPLILLAIDKIFSEKKILWSGIFTLSLIASFLAGYLQPFFYLFLVINAYIIFRAFETKKYKLLLLFFIFQLSTFILVSPQLFATFQFISLSARDLDQSNWLRPDWFLPWQNLVQLVAPDFFGNPATLNYFGVWNYQEFVSYIGLAPLIFAAIAFIDRQSRTIYFFIALLVVSLLFALPNAIAQIPFILNIPFIATSQPSRLVFLICFSLSALSAFGVNSLLVNFAKLKSRYLLPVLALLAIMLMLYVFAASFDPVSHRNMLLPAVTAVLVSSALLSFKLSPKLKPPIFIIIILITIFDLWRFGAKFLPFSDPKFLFPQTASSSFLVERSREEIFRIAAVDDRIFAPNFSVAYKLQFISGYDPLYLRRYGEFIAAVGRNKPDPSPPFGFNRIIVPKNYNSKFFDLLGVKYILSLDEVKSPKYKLVFEEGQTKIYENSNYLPRVFFAKNVYFETDKQKIFNLMFKKSFNPATDAVMGGVFESASSASSSAEISSYTENEIIIETTGGGYLILTDPYYPTWHAEIDGKETEIFPADYVFRAIMIPPGRHQIRFFVKLF